jgi:spore maturation protein CgeB
VRVGIVGRPAADSFGRNIGDALLRMGHQVIFLGSTIVERGGGLANRVGTLAMQTFPDLEDRFHHRLVRAACERECDAVITTQANLSPHAVAALRRNRIPVALWFPDCVSNLGRQMMLVAPYTALFFKDPLLVERLCDTLDQPAWYLPEACNPRIHRPVGEAGEQRAIVVVGNTYPSRIMLLRRLCDAGIPVVVYGGATPRWALEWMPPGLHTGRAVFGEDKARVFRGHAAVLNNLHPAEMRGVNCRLFEATASGAAVLCERRPALDTLFDLDREIVPFRDFGELVDGARALLADRQLGRDIGDAASKRAHADHTYEQRLPTILEKLT